MKLSHGARLTRSDCDILIKAFSKSIRVEARHDLIQEGEVPVNVHLVLDGVAYRYKILPGGTRQIVGLLLPGDFCDLHVAVLNQMDHTIGTITPCHIALLDRKSVLELIAQSPAVTLALWWATLVDEAVLREWLVGMGRRPADKQVAHLFCELLIRLQVVGLATENSYEFPLSQTDLSDILGLTPVHVNRMLQQLRGDGLIVLGGKQLTIPDVARLRDFADFEPNYLHLEPGRGAPG